MNVSVLFEACGKFFNLVSCFSPGVKKKQLLVDRPDDDLVVNAYDAVDDYDFMWARTRPSPSVILCLLNSIWFYYDFKRREFQPKKKSIKDLGTLLGVQQFRLLE